MTGEIIAARSNALTPGLPAVAGGTWLWYFLEIVVILVSFD